MQWKGKIPAGKTYDHPIQNLDVLPTAVAAAGGKVDPAWKLDGVDLLPYLTGKVKEAAARGAVLAFRRAVGDPQGRLEARGQQPDGVDEPRLFNLKDDIGEKNDLSAKSRTR